MTFHFDGSSVPGTFRNDNLSAALLGYEGDEAVDGFLVLSRRVGHFSAKLRNVVLLSRSFEFRQLNALLNTLVFFVVPS